MSRDIVITGLGIVCAGAKNCEELTKMIISGSSALTVINDPLVAHFGTRYAGLITDFTLADYCIDAGRYTDEDIYTQYALGAAQQALTQSRFDMKSVNKRIGMLFATCSGPMLTIENYYKDHLQNGYSNIIPEKRAYKRATDVLCSHFEIHGFRTTITTACSSSATVIGMARDLIEQGVIDAAFVGGADSFSTTTLAGFEGLKAVSQHKCAPFSVPIGMNLGAAGAFLFLEASDIALERGANIIGTVLGYGISNDALHPTTPDATGRGQAMAIERAFSDAGCDVKDIGYINAHGTGTAANDRAETKAIIRAFGNHAEKIAVSSTKSQFGHCLGAAGSLEIIASLLGAQAGVFPATAQFTKPRDGCSLDYISDTSRPWKEKKIFVKNSFAFAGNNVSLVLATHKYDKKSTFTDTKNVVITGIGIISPAGIGSDKLYCDNDNANYATKIDINGRTVSGAYVGQFNEREINRRLDLRSMDNASRYAVIAAHLALSQSRFSKRPSEFRKLGFLIGLDSGSTVAEAQHILALIESNYKLRHVQRFPYIVPNAIGGNVCRTFGIQGHNSVLSDGSGSGLSAITMGYSALKANHCSSVLCGATDELTNTRLLDSLNFADNVVSGEGSAFFMLETAKTAALHNAPVIAELLGITTLYGVNNQDTIENSLIKMVNKTAVSVDEIGFFYSNISCVSTKKVAPNAEIGLVSDFSSIGYAPTSQPLFELGRQLVTTSVGLCRKNKYILSCFVESGRAISAFLLKIIDGI